MAIAPITLQAFDQACSYLEQGEVVAMPTETVYGLAGDAYQDKAIAKIYQTKGRPQFNPLIIHYADLESLAGDVIINGWAEKLAKAFWPGPLTMVLPKKETSPVSLLACAGLPTLAVRVPGHPVALDLIRQYGKPLAAPSANLSNTISPTTALDVAASLKEGVAMILEGGACHVGLESTIIDLTGNAPVILRPGGVTIEQLESALGLPVSLHTGQAIKAPGMLKRHYAPSIPLRLNACDLHEGEIYIGFGDKDKGSYNLSRGGDLVEAAANLFRMMRLADQPSYQGIAIAPIPHEGLGLAINDRLNRAACQED